MVTILLLEDDRATLKEKADPLLGSASADKRNILAPIPDILILSVKSL